LPQNHTIFDFRGWSRHESNEISDKLQESFSKEELDQTALQLLELVFIPVTPNPEVLQTSDIDFDGEPLLWPGVTTRLHVNILIA
jgi:hypothetical protein